MENNDHIKTMQENASKYAIFNSISNEAIIILDLDDLIIVETNNAFTKIFGYPHSEIIGKSIIDFVPQNNQKIILTKLSQEEIKLFETLGIKKDGMTIPIEIVGKKIDIKDKPSYFIVIRDISDKKANKEKAKLIKEYKVENELTKSLILLVKSLISKTNAWSAPRQSEILSVMIFISVSLVSPDFTFRATCSFLFSLACISSNSEYFPANSIIKRDASLPYLETRTFHNERSGSYFRMFQKKSPAVASLIRFISPFAGRLMNIWPWSIFSYRYLISVFMKGSKILKSFSLAGYQG